MIAAQVRGSGSHGRRCGGGRSGSGGVQNRRRCRRGGDAPGGVGTGGDTEVECVDQMVAGGIVDANLARLAKSGRAGEGQEQVGVGIDMGGIISGETR